MGRHSDPIMLLPLQNPGFSADPACRVYFFSYLWLPEGFLFFVCGLGLVLDFGLGFSTQYLCVTILPTCLGIRFVDQAGLNTHRHTPVSACQELGLKECAIIAWWLSFQKANMNQFSSQWDLSHALMEPELYKSSWSRSPREQ